MSIEAWVVENLPSSWVVVPINAICNVVRGGSPRPMGDPRYFNGNIPFIKISDVTKSNGVFVEDSETKVNSEGAKRSRFLKKGTLILSNSGTICVPVFLGVDACIHDGFVTFEALPEEIDKKYLYYFFKYIKPYILNKHRQGMTQVNLNTTLVGEIDLLFPPTNEQKRIVAKIEELFSELDKGIESLKTAREQLKVYRQAVLKHAFEGKFTTEWRDIHSMDATDSQVIRVERMNASDIHDELTPLYADTWPWTRLGSISKVSGGLTKNPKRQKLPLKMKYLRVANVYADKIFLDDVLEIGVTDEEFDAVRLVPGDLLVVEGNGSVGQIGRVAVWDGQLSDVGHQNHLIRVRLVEGMNPRFFLYFLMSPLGRELIVKKASSTSGLHTLSISKVSSLPVPVPSTGEQSEIVHLFEAQMSIIENLESTIEAELEKSESLRQSILKKAFSGKLVAQDPNDEPASVLLERIRAEKESPVQQQSRLPQVDVKEEESVA